MSRSDFWSIAATLIVAGIAYFIGGARTAYGCIGLGVAIALYLLATNKKPPTQVPVENKQKQEVRQVVKQEANPSLKQDFHFNLPGPAPAPPRVSPAKPKAQHNLQFHSCSMAKIGENLGSHGEMNGFHFPEDQSKPNAAIVCIKNKSREGEVAYLNEVRAALTFRDHKGQEIGRGIDQACWVETHLKNPSFDVEETHCVILAVIRDDGVLVPSVRGQMTQFGMCLNVDAVKLETVPSTVKLILVANGNRVMEPKTFAFFDDADGKPGIRLVE